MLSMAARMQELAKMTREYASAHSLPLDVAIDVVTDTRYNRPDLFQDESSNVTRMKIGYRGKFKFTIIPEVIKANIAELFDISRNCVIEAGYTPQTETSSVGSLYVSVRKGLKELGRIVVMDNGKPGAGVRTETYDLYGNSGLSVDKERGVAFEFAEDQQEAA